LNIAEKALQHSRGKNHNLVAQIIERNYKCLKKSYEKVLKPHDFRTFPGRGRRLRIAKSYYSTAKNIFM